MCDHQNSFFSAGPTQICHCESDVPACLVLCDKDGAAESIRNHQDRHRGDIFHFREVPDFLLKLHNGLIVFQPMRSSDVHVDIFHTDK